MCPQNGIFEVIVNIFKRVLYFRDPKKHIIYILSHTHLE